MGGAIWGKALIGSVGIELQTIGHHFSPLSVITELIPLPLLSCNHSEGPSIKSKRKGNWCVGVPYLAKQQASNVPASWKTTTTAREAASAGTVPAKRTEKQPDSIWASSWGSVRRVRSRAGKTQPVEAWPRPQDLDRWSWKRSSRRKAPDIIFQEISSLHMPKLQGAFKKRGARYIR